MDTDSSPSESDCIDDTGCEDLFQSSYWDINYVHAIEKENGPENEENSDKEEDFAPYARALPRIRYDAMNESGEFVQEDYYNPQEEDSSDEEDSSEPDSSEDQKESSESDECEKEEPLTEEEKKIKNWMHEMGLSTERDALYDPSIDEKDAVWSSQQHYEIPETNHKTDAILCCPSCFTTICYECKLVKHGVWSNVHRKYEKEGSNVFLAKKVYNCYVVGGNSIQATVNDGHSTSQISLGYAVVCSVCGNEVGFENNDEYLLMNMIEEDGDVYGCFYPNTLLKDYNCNSFTVAGVI